MNTEAFTVRKQPGAYYEELSISGEQIAQPERSGLRQFAGRVAAVLALTGTLLAGNTIAHSDEAEAATPTCYGDYCSGQYPDQTGCDADARTLTEFIITDKGVRVGANISTQPGITIDQGGSETEIAKVEVRWSDLCGTAWARLNTREDTDINVIGVEQDGGYEQTRSVRGFATGSPSALSFTPMIYGRDHSYQAFITRDGGWSSPFGDERTSTYWTDEDLREE